MRAWLFILVGLVACGGSPAPKPVVAPPAPVVHHLADPDVNKPRETKLLSIDWSVDRDGNELWKLIAPTGADWEAKLDEVPEAQTDKLALALLQGGNFACAIPAGACGVPADLPAPAPTAGLDDPCLRRLLALWSIAQLEPDQLPKDVLRAIAALPPPESQLVGTAIRAVPESEQDFRLELLAIAWQAGQRELVAAILPDLDEAHVATALTKHHIDAALESLTADRHRGEFLAAIADERIGAVARNQAMVEVAALDTTTTGRDVLAPDLQKALIAATHSKDCAVVAAAAHMFEARGDHRFGPKRPRARKVEPLMRAVCVLAHYEEMQRADEPSYLPGYVPAAGIDLTRVTYDEYADPHTTESTEHVARDQVVLPELEDLIRALDHCTGSVCTSEEHEFRFDWKPGPGGDLLLARIAVVERPSCGMIKP
ncbi:MAG: hypothetical protein JO257_21280 [Deltaproteobacteria bacterium]|nr:hypothetical protein [Deltaproteobacteria bacterium]